jgi:hypothetical protein
MHEYIDKKNFFLYLLVSVSTAQHVDKILGCYTFHLTFE